MFFNDNILLCGFFAPPCFDIQNSIYKDGNMSELKEKIIWEPFEKMEQFMIDIFVKEGVPEADAKICAEVLIEADKRGVDSHGVGRFKPIYIDRIRAGILNPVTNIEVVRETMTTAVLDGHNGMGHVIGKYAMQMAIDKAKKTGMGMVAVRNSTHFGIAGYYPIMAAKEDMIGFVGTNARPSIAPTFGVENMMGTNPLVFGIPTDEPFVFVTDYATSITQRGKIETLEREGKPIPEGWVIDEKGNTRTDPTEVLKELEAGTCALLPVGSAAGDNASYKGYGYSVVVEVLSAALQAGSYLKMLSGHGPGGERTPIHIGHFFMAIDINAFIEAEKFKATTGDIMRTLRASKKAPGHDRIFTAGEKEYLYWLENKDKGVPLNTAMQKTVAELRDEYALPYTFGFDE
jgi:LDH2 family malate/lactate/ureidoglycolate dehydrogenase